MSDLTHFERLGSLQGYSEGDAELVRMRQKMRDAAGRRYDLAGDEQEQNGETADPAPAGDPSFQVSSGLR